MLGIRGGKIVLTPSVMLMLYPLRGDGDGAGEEDQSVGCSHASERLICASVACSDEC